MARTQIGLAVLGAVGAMWSVGGAARAQEAAADAHAPGVAVTITVEQTPAPSPTPDASLVVPPPPASAPAVREPAPAPSAASALSAPTVFIGVPSAPPTYPIYAPPLAAAPTARLAAPARWEYDTERPPSADFGARATLADEPPSEGRRVGRMFVEASLGIVGMAVGGVGGALLGLAPCAGDSGGGDLASSDACVGSMVGGAVLGMGFGTPAGIVLGGSALDGNGGFGWTLLGTSAGFLVAGGLAPSVDDSDSAYALGLLPVLGGIVAYELSSDVSASYAERHAQHTVQASVSPTKGGAAVSVSGTF